MDKGKRLTKLRRFIEERLVINPADIPKLAAFVSGAYIIYEVIPKKVWVVTDPKGKEHKLAPSWAGYAPYGSKSELREVEGFSIWHAALATFGSYMLIEHGKYMFGLAGSLATILTP